MILQIKVRARARGETYVRASPRVSAPVYGKGNAVEPRVRPKASGVAVMGASLLTTPLDNQVTDCLRFSMSFFHPIQQSAKQLYHTALPLSPTSSLLRKSCLQQVTDNQLSRVATFLGAPSAWGLLLRSIDVRPRRLSCIATSVQGVIAACGDIVNVYDAITFVLRQSLRAPETVTKIRDSSDGSILFFAHSSSVTMWDVQTGGHIHTFTTRSTIQDMAVSTTGDHIACGLSSGSVEFWNIHTKEEGESFEVEQPIVAIHWPSHRVLVAATLHTLHTHDIIVGKITDKLPVPGRVWGMVYFEGQNEFLVGASRKKPQSKTGQKESFFVVIGWGQGGSKPLSVLEQSVAAIVGQLSNPVLVNRKIVCLTPAGGVRSFDPRHHSWTESPPLLDAALSVAVSLNRNLVVQTEDSIQILPVDVLASVKVNDDDRWSHIYPLGERHIACVLQQKKHFTLLELETLGEVGHDHDTWSLGSPSVETRRFDTLLSEWGNTDEDVPFGGLSPNFTWVVTVSGSPQKLSLRNARHGLAIESRILTHDELQAGEAYGVVFGSENRFYLKVAGPGWRVQIPYDIVASPASGYYSHTITKGKPVPLQEPRATSPYILDENCEWVLDAESRKICWISPGNIRRGKGGHFWAGLSLVMVGDDRVVRKLTLKDPDC